MKKMLTNVKSLKEYLLESLKMPESCIEIYSADGTVADSRKLLTTLLSEYGIDNPNVIEGIGRGATSTYTVTDTIESIARKCCLPKECIKFKDKDGLILHGSNLISTVREKYNS